MSIISCESPELKLITELNKFFNFDHNLFLLQSSADVDRFICLRSRQDVTPHTVFVVGNTDENTSNTTNIRISSKDTFAIVIFDGSENDFSYDTNFDLFDELKEIQSLTTNMKIGIFLPQLTSMDDLSTLFEWCKDNLVTYVFAAFYMHADGIEQPTTKAKLNIFTFNHFGSLHLINLTNSEAYENYFPDMQSNFHQHQLRFTTSFERDIFRELWFAVLRLMNASYVVEDKVYDDVSEYFKNGCDCSPGFYIQDWTWKFDVYPLYINKWEIIVPHALPYEDFSAYLRIVASNEFFGFALFTVVAVTSSIAICRYVQGTNSWFARSVVDVLNLLMNDNAYINYRHLSRAEVFMFCPLTFVGFVVTNGIVSNLQSYLTRPILQPQMKTLEDIFNSPFPITTQDEYWKMRLLWAFEARNEHQKYDWNDKIIALEYYQYEKALYFFNSSLMYYDSDSVMYDVFRLEKRLNLKAYYNPQLHITTTFYIYRMSPTFLFFDRFNQIVHRMRSAGLMELWQRFDDGTHYDLLKKNVERLNQLKGNDFQKIEFPTFIFYGWTAGIILFILEIIWNNLGIKNFSIVFGGKCERFCTIIVRKLR